MNISPVLLKDGYKVGHVFQYPPKTTCVYSNFTPRSSRVKGVNSVIWFGAQYFIKEYLIDSFDDWFDMPCKDAVGEYKQTIEQYIGPTNTDHIEALHKLGFLPLHIKALPEGTRVPMRVPCLTITNTHEDFYWLPNMLETVLSNVLWLPSTSATTACEYRREFEWAARITGGDREFVKWQGHDFSMRGLAGIEAACLSGAAHLLAFTGSDSIPAIEFINQYYPGENGLIAGSVPATEHSVMCVDGVEDEFNTFKRLITEVYPTGIVSIVSDTWDLWKVLTEYLPKLKDTILTRDGKVVIRPDSGDPVKIICGDPDGRTLNEQKGVVRLLDEVFGSTRTVKEYKQLNSHIGVIYGDSITPDRQLEILARLQAAGFASTNVVLGIGSFTYQHVTRDTFGWAMKATYAEVDGKGREIFKKPVTDNGTKNSATGLLRVDRVNGQLVLTERCSWDEQDGGELRSVFMNGILLVDESFATIRARVEQDITR
jgi:nicotinamide phosphoribosyltransferase